MGRGPVCIVDWASGRLVFHYSELICRPGYVKAYVGRLAAGCRWGSVLGCGPIWITIFAARVVCFGRIIGYGGRAGLVSWLWHSVTTGG